MARRAKKNYVNNNDFLEALGEYKQKCLKAKAENRERPVVPPYIGECIYHISNRLSTKANFSGYPFREDMVMDGIENCLMYMDNFDPNTGSNPFAYFTRIIWFAFLRRIAKEKKYLYTKLKCSQSMIAHGETHAGGEDIAVQMNFDTDYMDSFIEDFEEKLANDREKSKKKSKKT